MNRSIKYRILADNPNKFLYYEYIPTMGFILKGAKLEENVEIGEGYPQQYTGINDVNGKEIYEGDIVRYKEKLDEHGDVQTLEAEVFYAEECAAFVLGKNDVWNTFHDFGIGDIEVISHAFEKA